MKFLALNTATGLKPLYDEDYEEKRKLKLGTIYNVEVKEVRNYQFLKKYHALIGCAWEYLPERVANGFRSKDGFRAYVQVAAGYYDVFYSPKLREWVEYPCSISFSSMEESKFKELYEKVKDVIFSIIGKYVSEEEFEKNLINF